VIQKYAAGSQQPEGLGKVLGQHLLAHVLHHSDANELVETAMFLNIAIINDFDPTEIPQASAAVARCRSILSFLAGSVSMFECAGVVFNELSLTHSKVEPSHTSMGLVGNSSI